MKARETKLYNLVISEITKIREQGDPPMSDVLSLDNFVCDLCKGVIPRTKITQCPFCGRWICRAQCWENKERSCLACSGVIKLCKESMRLESAGELEKVARKLPMAKKGEKPSHVKKVMRRLRWKK